jgi:sugar diacid utilization regulator
VRRRALTSGPERVRVPDLAQRRGCAAAAAAGDRALRRRDHEHGGQLIDTLLAYAESDLNANAAAERLLIHVNTAHYRLGRIEEKTGCDLRRLADVIDLLIAVRLADA